LNLPALTWGVKFDGLNVLFFTVFIKESLYFLFFCVYSDRFINLFFCNKGAQNERTNKNSVTGQADVARHSGGTLQRMWQSSMPLQG